MLYTFSQADYNNDELTFLLTNANDQDAVLLWQDGVLLAVKYPDLFTKCTANCYALELDLNARNLVEFIPSKVRSISMPFLVELTEHYTPQFGM